MMCSNSIDVVGKFAKENGHSYSYKNDDLIAAASCGMDSVEINTSINTLIELKKLTFHTPVANKKGKCHLMHIGKENKGCPEMKVHGQTVDRVSQAV